MNENIDLTKILKDCPEGYEFYSSYFGKVIFIRISYGQIIVGCTKINRQVVFNADGKYEMWAYSDNGNYPLTDECLLFPSKEQRDWSKFKAPWYKKNQFDPNTLKPFDKVLVKDTSTQHWNIGIFSHYIKGDTFPYKCVGTNYKLCIPYNDDTKHLVGTTDEAPEYYKYWED